VTATSRIGFAMARDGLLPGSQYLRVVHKTWQVSFRLPGHKGLHTLQNPRFMLPGDTVSTAHI
jgi:hypothetical protein